MAFSPPDPPVVFTDYPNHTTPTNAQNLNKLTGFVRDTASSLYTQIVGEISNGVIDVSVLDGGTSDPPAPLTGVIDGGHA